MYWELFLEFATPPTERLPCRRCGVALAMDEPCVSSGVFTTVEGVPGRGASKNMHVRCAVDLDAEAVVRLLDRDPLEFVGRAAIDALARARVAAITAANKKRKKPDTTEAPVVERARDPLGRPRVRVLFTGPYRGPESLFVDQTMPGPKHEFVLVRHTSIKSARIDPSQPWIAAVYFQSATDGIATVRGPLLIEWSALGLPPPIIVVTGDSDASKRDALVLSLRKMLAKAGFEADECPALTALSVDDALLEALAAELEARAALATEGPNADREERLVARLEAALDAGPPEAVLPAAKKALRVVGRARVAEKQRVLDGLCRAASVRANTTAIVRATLELSDNQLSEAWLLALARTLLAPEVAHSSAIDALLSRWQRSAEDTEAMPALLVEALEREPPSSARARSAAAWLARLGTKKSRAALRAIIERADTSKSRRTLIELALAPPAAPKKKR